MRHPVAARALREVVLEVEIARRGLRDAARGRRRKHRAAEVGVRDDAGRVDDDARRGREERFRARSRPVARSRRRRGRGTSPFPPWIRARSRSSSSRRSVGDQRAPPAREGAPRGRDRRAARDAETVQRVDGPWLVMGRSVLESCANLYFAALQTGHRRSAHYRGPPECTTWFRRSSTPIIARLAERASGSSRSSTTCSSPDRSRSSPSSFGRDREDHHAAIRDARFRSTPPGSTSTRWSAGFNSLSELWSKTIRALEEAIGPAPAVADRAGSGRAYRRPMHGDGPRPRARLARAPPRAPPRRPQEVGRERREALLRELRARRSARRPASCGTRAGCDKGGASRHRPRPQGRGEGAPGPLTAPPAGEPR